MTVFKVYGDSLPTKDIRAPNAGEAAHLYSGYHVKSCTRVWVQSSELKGPRVFEAKVVHIEVQHSIKEVT